MDKLFALLAVLTASAFIFVTPAMANCNAGGTGQTGNGNPCNDNSAGGGVPGPIAGVGLPFLILGGIAYRRRRKSLVD